MDQFDAGLLARIQFGFTIGFHILFPTFTIGIAGVINRFHATFHTPLDEHTREAFAAGSPIPIPAPPAEPPGS